MIIKDGIYNKKIAKDSKKVTEVRSEDQEYGDDGTKGIHLGVDLAKLIAQSQAEHDVAFRHQKPKKDELLVRLKLFNNQKREKGAVGDTTMFSIFQTVLASLYADRLMVDWRGKEDGDEETADNLNALSKSDYDDMEKDIIDYNWDWDTLFAGRGLILMEEFLRDPDQNIFIPLPENIDFTTWLRDPLATSVNGDRSGKGAMRFGGQEIKIGKQEMLDHPLFFKNIKFEELKFGSSTYSLLEDAKVARDNAQNNQTQSKDDEGNLGVNAQYTITEWFTHAEVDGKIKKVKVWLANERTKVVGLKILKRDYWPIQDRVLYQNSHDWDGTSIPDLTEDKQRARAVAQNLGMRAMKADLEPMYIYDTNKVKNKNDLDFEFNKFVGIEANPGQSVGDSIMPLNKANPNMQLLQFIYESIDLSAQKAAAVPDIKMGIQSQADRPLGETNLISSNVDTRFSLSAKVFGWSEKRFWQMHWYNSYKDNFQDDIDEKILRIVGAFGSKWRKLTKKDIICRLDPDVYIESKVVSRAKDMEDRQLLTNYYASVLADPTANRRWAMKDLGRLNGLGKDKIDRLFPPTVDERIAEKQNDLLNEDKLVPVLPEDDHVVHLEIHAMAKETNASKAHIETHIKALSVKKVKPELFPPDQMVSNMGPDAAAGSGKNVMPGVSAMPMKPIMPSQTSNQP